jgi:hypothetical protein
LYPRSARPNHRATALIVAAGLEGSQEWDAYHAEVTDWERSQYLLNL